MNDKHRVRVSKFISKHLRHAPAEIGLTLEPGGWVGVDTLLAAAGAHGFLISRAELEEVVAKCDKQRCAFDETGTRIRANQGHSVEVDLELDPAVPPELLYHGTALRTLPLILDGGLLKMARHHVHLSRDFETALKVGGRHGKPVVLSVAAGKMAGDGFTFFVSSNGVWLVDRVPPTYLSVIPTDSATT
ncbi:RNA 2'-phosphotransferase [Fimbriiglobus ruber]|uniref:Probable RNA 2'-phosphotransferase n=1 Tax=Fimbriiglobus ruber TaxID=1908690 RepID=A0A225E101_9BACT|nr:RNA 2'-phosphotransferase [Fimbriiglobus ruber]OWK47251.1 RNA:NAD 2'-phosphotransferase [Fimbriiglobus ruber]